MPKHPTAIRITAGTPPKACVAFDVSPIRHPIGGVGRYAAELAAALTDEIERRRATSGEARWEDLTLLTNRPAALREIIAGSQGRGLGAAEILTGRLRRPTLAWLQLQLPRLIAASGAQLAHFTTGRAPLRLTVPYVLTVHDVTALTHPHLDLRRERWLVAPWLAASIRRAAGIIAVSEHTAAAVATLFPAAGSRLTVIPEAPPAIFREPLDPLVVRDWQRRIRTGNEQNPAPVSSRVIWLCVATFTTRKGFGVLLDAAARARSILSTRGVETVLIIAGSGSQTAGLRDLVAQYGLSDMTRLLGYVADSDLPYLFAAADTIVVPSLHEGFGLVALEGMASGRAVICTDAGALPEVVGRAAEVVPVGSTVALADTLVRLSLDPVRRAELSELGLKRAATFSWQRAAASTLDVYTEVLHGWAR